MRLTDSRSIPHDYCRQCFPSEDFAFEEWGNVGDGPDGRGNCFEYDCDHPPYEDGETYRCHECGEVLTEADD